MTRGDNLSGSHQAGWDVDDAPLELYQGPDPRRGALSKLALPVWVAGEPCGLGTPVASADGPGPVGLGGQGLVVPGRTALGVGPHGFPGAGMLDRAPHRFGLAALVPLAP